MIGDYFLNKSLIFTCTVKTLEFEYSDFFVDLLFVLKSYDSETNRDDFSLEFKEKFDLLKYLVSKRCESVDIDVEELIEDLHASKYKNHIPYLKGLVKEKITKEDLTSFYVRVQKRKFMYEAIFSERELSGVLNDIETENYENEDEVLTKYEKLLNKLHNNLLEVKNNKACRQVSKLNLLEDDYTPVLDKIRRVTDIKKSIKTGYKVLADKFISGGFEPDRLYLIGGESGVGKSMLLVNLICNAIKLNDKNESENGKIDTLLYISAENYLHETFSRFYCCFNGISTKTMMKELTRNSDEYIKNKINKIILDSNCNIKFYYYEPDKTTVNDIESLVKEVMDNDKYNLKCVYIDYLDKISSGDFKGAKDKSDNNRFEQGLVAKKFKLLTNRYSIPIVTCTQLNRSGYNVDAIPDLTQMGESMIKINESDAVIFLQNVSDSLYMVNSDIGMVQYKKIRMTLLKNRNGGISDPKILIMKQQINNIDAFDFRMIEIDEENINEETDNSNLMNIDELIKTTNDPVVNDEEDDEFSGKNSLF